MIISCGGEFVEVPVDGMGIQSSTLAEILRNWPPEKKMPKYLYTVPYGGNPTGTKEFLLNVDTILRLDRRSGATASVERRREVLALAKKYEFLILEGKFLS